MSRLGAAPADVVTVDDDNRGVAHDGGREHRRGEHEGVAHLELRKDSDGAVDVGEGDARGGCVGHKGGAGEVDDAAVDVAVGGHQAHARDAAEGQHGEVDAVAPRVKAPLHARELRQEHRRHGVQRERLGAGKDLLALAVDVGDDDVEAVVGGVVVDAGGDRVGAGGEAVEGEGAVGVGGVGVHQLLPGSARAKDLHQALARSTAREGCRESCTGLRQGAGAAGACSER